MNSEFTQIILNSLSHDGETRKHAEQYIEQEKEQRFAQFLARLAEEVISEDRPPELRLMAALMCKNAVTGMSKQTKLDASTKWLQIPKDQRDFIKLKFLQSLNSAIPQARSGAAQTVTQIGCIEIPAQQWPELIDILSQNVQEGNNFAKQASLETLGMICEELDFAKDNCLSAHSTKILSTIISGLAPGLPIEIAKAAINALLGSLAFVHENFKNLEQRNYIMNVILDATKFDNKEIQYISLQCLVRVADLYYDYLPDYVERAFQVTSNLILHQVDGIAQQAVEFWATICEEEVERIDLLSAGREDIKYYSIISKVIPHLFPYLGQALTRQSESVDQDWNVATCAVACVTLIAQTIEDDFMPILLPYISANINHPEWRMREAATVALGSVLEFCQSDNTSEILIKAIPLFLDRMKNDQNLKVKDTTAWAIAKAAEHHPTVIFDNNFVGPVIETLFISLTAPANVASQACYALLNVIQIFPARSQNSSLSQVFQPLLERLIATSERQDADEYNLRLTAYECINALVSNTPEDVKDILYKLTDLLIDRIGKTFEIDMDDEEKREFQNYLCSVLQTITMRLQDEIQKSEQLLQVFFRVLDYNSELLPEEALMAVSSIIAIDGSLVPKYLNYLTKYTVISLTHYENNSGFIAGLSLLGTICGTLEGAFYTMDNGVFCDTIISLLCNSITSGKLAMNITPSVLNSYGEIAASITDNSVKYLPMIMPMLNIASQATADFDNDDEVEYLISLRESILETYTMFIQALKEPSARSHISVYLADILNFIGRIWMDDQSSRDPLLPAMIGIIGDISVAFGELVKPMMQHQVIRMIIDHGLHSQDPKILKVSRWAQSVIPK